MGHFLSTVLGQPPSALTRYQWYDLFSGGADDLADLLERSTLNPT